MRASRSLGTPIVFVVRRWFCKLPVVAPPSPKKLRTGGRGRPSAAGKHNQLRWDASFIAFLRQLRRLIGWLRVRARTAMLCALGQPRADRLRAENWALPTPDASHRTMTTHWSRCLNSPRTWSSTSTSPTSGSLTCTTDAATASSGASGSVA